MARLPALPHKTAAGENPRVTFATVGETLTNTSHARECDINTIMAKYAKTGILEHRNTFEGQYGDFTDGPQDYQESMNQVLRAQEMFQTLPAQVRKRFGNDPASFLEFVSDPNSRNELYALGLAVKPVEDVIEDSAPSAPKKAEPASDGAPSASKT